MPDEVYYMLLNLEKEIVAINLSGKSWYDKLYDVAKLIIPKVEEIGTGLKGADKKALAIKIIDEALDRYVKIRLPRFVVHWVVGTVIDKIVAYFNSKGIFKHAKP